MSLKTGDRVTRRGKGEERVVANLLRAAWRQVCGGGTWGEGGCGGGHDRRRGWKSNASRRVRIGANKGVKDIFGELVVRPSPPKKGKYSRRRK